MKKCMEATISGRVQLVMFRDFAKRKARAHGLTGFVQNKKDGTVYVLAEGEEENLKKFLTRLHRGPILAEVTNVEVVYQEPTSKYTDFSILYD